MRVEVWVRVSEDNGKIIREIQKTGKGFVGAVDMDEEAAMIGIIAANTETQFNGIMTVCRAVFKAAEFDGEEVVSFINHMTDILVEEANERSLTDVMELLTE